MLHVFYLFVLPSLRITNFHVAKVEAMSSFCYMKICRETSFMQPQATACNATFLVQQVPKIATHSTQPKHCKGFLMMVSSGKRSKRGNCPAKQEKFIVTLHECSFCHFLLLQVQYCVYGFVDKNNDLLYRDLSQCMYSCSHPLTKTLFPEGNNGLVFACCIINKIR